MSLILKNVKYLFFSKGVDGNFLLEFNFFFSKPSNWLGAKIMNKYLFNGTKNLHPIVIKMLIKYKILPN